jgi:hypothetical protein
MQATTFGEIRADFRSDLRANRLPNTTELAEWRNRVSAARCPLPLSKTVEPRAHAGSVVTTTPAAAASPAAGNSGRAVEHRSPALPASTAGAANG